MLGTCGAQDIPCVLHEHVLEPPSGRDEWDAALTRSGHRGKRPFHASIRARRRQPDPGEAFLELGGRGHGVRRDPLPFGARVGEAGVEHRVSLVRGIPVADDADEHVPTLPLETAGTIGSVAAPLTKDQELDLTIDSLAYGGNGVARLNGFVVFVRRGLPGDTVRAKVTKVKRNHAEATALEIVDAGAPRVEAPCAHYPACGGCRFQDLNYEAQTAAKEAQVADSLRRIAGIAEPPLEPIVPAEEI